MYLLVVVFLLQLFLLIIASVYYSHYSFYSTMSCAVVTGPLWNAKQTLQGCTEEHWPRDQSRDHGCGWVGKDTEQLPSSRLCGVPAGWCGGETQRPKEKGDECNCTVHQNTATTLTNISIFSSFLCATIIQLQWTTRFVIPIQIIWCWRD